MMVNLGETLRKRRTPLMMGGLLGATLGGIAVYDALKGKAYDTAGISELAKKDKVDSIHYVGSKDPSIRVVTGGPELDNLVDLVFGKKNTLKRETAANILNQITKTPTNAMTFSNRRQDFIVSAPQTSRAILNHEIGHVNKFRSEVASGKFDKLRKRDESFVRGVGRVLSKTMHNKDVMGPEEEAWRRAEKSKNSEEMQRLALNSYNKAFHTARSNIAGRLGGIALGATVGNVVGDLLLGGTIGPEVAKAAGGAVGSIVGKIPAKMIEKSEKKEMEMGKIAQGFFLEFRKRANEAMGYDNPQLSAVDIPSAGTDAGTSIPAIPAMGSAGGNIADPLMAQQETAVPEINTDGS